MLGGRDVSMTQTPALQSNMGVDICIRVQDDFTAFRGREPSLSQNTEGGSRMALKVYWSSQSPDFSPTENLWKELRL